MNTTQPNNTEKQKSIEQIKFELEMYVRRIAKEKKMKEKNDWSFMSMEERTHFLFQLNRISKEAKEFIINARVLEEEEYK